MSWITITDADITGRMNAAETAALQSVQGGTQTIAVVASDVTIAIRGKCKAGGNRLGADGTIPASLKLEAVSLAIWLWLASFPENKKLQTAPRESNYNEARAALDQVARGELKVELPDPGQTDGVRAPVNAVQVATRERRLFRRRQLRGL